MNHLDAEEEIDLRLIDIKAHPDRHRHGFADLANCCTVRGVRVLQIVDAHEGLTGTNGGIGCDVLSGPCACGAWH